MFFWGWWWWWWQPKHTLHIGVEWIHDVLNLLSFPLPHLNYPASPALHSQEFQEELKKDREEDEAGAPKAITEGENKEEKKAE